jgi:hypothetical protein
MKRIAGLAAVLGLAAAACSDSPTAPSDTGVKAKVANAEAKAALARSMGDSWRQSVVPNDGLQRLVSPPPFFVTPFGTDLQEDDDDCRTVNLPFVFTFYGRQYNRVSVNSNGNITFDGCFTQFSPTTLPAGGHPIIAGLFADWLSARDEGAGSVFVRTMGDPPLRRLVVTWAGVQMFARPGSRTTHQVQLLEFLNTIIMSYNGINTLTAGGTNWTGTPLTAGIASGVFTGFGGFAPKTIVGVGSQIPALDGQTFCLINLGSDYRVFSGTFCTLFVH